MACRLVSTEPLCIWTNAGILLTRPLETNFSEILSDIHTFSFNEIHLKMSSGKWHPFCLGLNVLNQWWHYHKFSGINLALMRIPLTGALGEYKQNTLWNSFWCAILIAHQIVMAKHGGSCVHFSGISTCGRTSRETVSHPQCPPLPTLCKISLPIYVIVTNKLLQPLTTTWYDSLVLSI